MTLFDVRGGGCGDDRAAGIGDLALPVSCPWRLLAIRAATAGRHAAAISASRHRGSGARRGAHHRRRHRIAARAGLSRRLPGHLGRRQFHRRHRGAGRRGGRAAPSSSLRLQAGRLVRQIMGVEPRHRRRSRAHCCCSPTPTSCTTRVTCPRWSRSSCNPRLDMVSEMVRLNCSSLAERALVPAFVYFFQMLYPFSRVNDPPSRVAAAAGGTVLIRRDALQRIGGIEAIKDCADRRCSARQGSQGFGSDLSRPLRASPRPSGPYARFADIWHMISRTAFTQLRLFGGAVGAHPDRPDCGVVGAGGGDHCLGGVGCVPAARRPMQWRRAAICRHCAATGATPLWALVLPLIAVFYMAATLGSAVNYWRGRGARWKSRAYGAD